MTCTTLRTARRRHLLLFACLAFQGANLAYAAAPDLSLSSSTLNFKYQTGAALPASQTLQVKSTGTALSFTVTVTGPMPYSARWLTVSANSGKTTASIKVYVNPTGLPSGTYSGTVAVNAPAAETPTRNVTVSLDVGDAAATLTASPAALSITYVSGDAAPSDSPVVLMTTGGALNASITITGGTWLHASPSGSIALVGLPATVTVGVDPTGLAPGSYSGKIVFSSTSAANKSVTVNITLNVSAGVPTISGVWPPGVLKDSASTVVTVTGTNYFSTSVASAGTTALTTTVLSPTAMLAAIPNTLLATAGTLSLTVSTPTASAASAAATFTVYGPGPQIWAVANAASYSATAISPGEILTIYGLGLGPSDLAVFPGTSPLPTSLPASGPATSVVIDGAPAPLLYTSASQVSCIVPYGVAAKSGSKVNVVLTYDSLPSTAFPVDVVDAHPGVFTVDSSGAGQGAILNFNASTGDYTVNGSSNAAVKGSIVVIYVTGSGQTTPAGDETALIAGAVTPATAPTVTIGGQAATVQGAAAPIGSVPGLLQINVTVPSAVTAGNSVPVAVSVGATQSQTRVTMAVK